MKTSINFSAKCKHCVYLALALCNFSDILLHLQITDLAFWVKMRKLWHNLYFYKHVAFYILKNCMHWHLISCVSIMIVLFIKWVISYFSFLEKTFFVPLRQITWVTERLLRRFLLKALAHGNRIVLHTKCLLELMRNVHCPCVLISSCYQRKKEIVKCLFWCNQVSW